MSQLKIWDANLNQWRYISQGIQGETGIQGITGIQGATGTAYWTANGNDISNANAGNVGIGTTTPVDMFDVGSIINGGNAAIYATLGSEMIPALSEGNWTLGTGWESPITGGVLNKNAAGDATAYPTPSIGLTAGQNYEVTITFSSFTVGMAYLEIAGNYGSPYFDTATTYTFHITPSASGNIGIYQLPESRFTISGFSIKPITNGNFTVAGNFQTKSNASFLGTGVSIGTTELGGQLHIKGNGRGGYYLEYPALLTLESGDSTPWHFVFINDSPSAGSPRTGLFYLDGKGAFEFATGDPNGIDYYYNACMTPQGFFSGQEYGMASFGTLGIGTDRWDTGIAKGLVMKNGTAANSSIADQIQLWAADYASGDSRLYLKSETGETLSFGNGAIQSSGVLSINAGGGNVGIGITNPSEKLEIVGTQTILTDTPGRRGILSLRDNTAFAIDVGPAISFAGKVNTGGAYYQFGAIKAGKAVANEDFASGYLSFLTPPSNGILAEHVRIDHAGNVGVGTTAPVQKLTVSNGNIQITDASGRLYLTDGNHYVSYDGTNTTILSGVGGISLAVNDASTISFITDSTHRMRLSATGGLSLGATYYLADAGSGNLIVESRIGIGITAPAHGLDLAGSARIIDGNGPAIYVNNGSEQVTAFKQTTGASSKLNIYDSKVSILADGKVGIGITTPVSRLTVADGTSTGIAMTTAGAAGSLSSPLYLDLDFLGYLNSNKARIRATENTGDHYGSTLSFLVNDANSSSSLVTRMVILKEGYVGIGTTAPSAKLEVNSATTQLISNLRGSNSTLNYFQFLSDYDTGNANYNGLNLQVGVYTGTPGYIRLQASDTSDYRILSLNPLGGNVGVGTTAPTSKLQISDSAKSGNDTPLTLTSTDASQKMRMTFSRFGNSYYRIQVVEDDVDYKNLVLQENGGNVGIGITTPTSQLHIYKSAASEIRQTIQNDSAANGAFATLLVNTTGNRYGAIVQYSSAYSGTTAGLSNNNLTMIQSGDQSSNLLIDSSNANLVFSTGTTERVRIDTSGNVGIGITAPPKALSIGNEGALAFLEESAHGTNYIAIKAPHSLGGDYTYTLPADYGTDNYVLTTDGAGTLTWEASASTGMTDPMTTAGDLIYRNTSNTTALLAISDAGKVLTATDIGGTVVPQWSNAPAGLAVGGDSSPAGQIQYYSSGNLGANDYFYFDATNYELYVIGSKTGSKLAQFTNTHTGNASLSGIQIGNSSGADTFGIYVNSHEFASYADYVYITQKLNAPMVFKTNNAEVMRITGTYLNITGLTASQAIFTDGSKNLISNAITGTGNVVMSTSPTLTTPTIITSLLVSDGAYIGQASGGKITFDDTNNYIEITVAGVGINVTTPRTWLHVGKNDVSKFEGEGGWSSFVNASTILGVSTVGGHSVTGVSATSDDSAGPNNMATIGIYGAALNDKTVNPNYAWAAYFEGRRESGGGTTHGVEINTVNHGTTTQVDPYSSQTGANNGWTTDLWLAAGRSDTLKTNYDLSMAIGIANNTSEFDKGIVFFNGSVHNNASSYREAIVMPTNYALVWYTAASTKGINMFATSTQLEIWGGNVYAASSISTPTISLTSGAAVNYVWKCTNAGTGAGAWSALSGSSITYVEPGTNTLSTAVAAASDGAILVLGAGNYAQTSAVTITDKAITIRGAGPQVTTVTFTGCHGFVCDMDASNDQFKHITIENLSVVTTDSGTYTGISYTGYTTALFSSTETELIIQNVWVRPSDYNNDYWDTGIRLIDAWNVKITGCTITGDISGAIAMSKGISIENQCCGVFISDLYIAHADYAIFVEDCTPFSEGVNLRGFTLFNVNAGIYWSAPTNGGLYLSVSDGHIESNDYGIYMNKVREASISNVLIYKDTGSSSNWFGISATSCLYTRINGCMIRTPDGISGSENGILLASGCLNGSITGNSFESLDAAIWLQSGANYNVVVGNSGNDTDAGGVGDIYNQGTGNTVADNLFT